ncbi:MAG: DUF1559 domain-containing protein [Planctomycetes bacterium]|nr:DUF1559 domain-containing protein [Planctomycetota bacterium]
MAAGLRSRPRRNRKAFTLIEVLVVVAIIALLVGTLISALSKAREQARRSVCASNQKQIMTGIHMYAIAGQIDRYPKGERLQARLDYLKQESLVSCMFLSKRDKRQQRGVWPHRGGVIGGYADGSARLNHVADSIAQTSADLYDKNDIDDMDYFAFCFFRMLSGQRRWIEAFPGLRAVR